MSKRGAPILHFMIFGIYSFTSMTCNADLSDLSPASACNYLATIGLRTTTYRQQADGNYQCITPHVDIGTATGQNGALNNIVYYVIGKEKSIDTIQLVIDVSNPNESVAIHRRLKDVSNFLAEKLHTELPKPIQEAIAVGRDAKAVVNKRAVSVQRSNRAANNAYSVQVVFE
ncbi:MAG TPA: hypothetical protein VLC91_03395 [Spongiibacteraceae bacterium]|nr:hypothetical protein [Spongiibacteraceae bacterium]